MRDNRAVKTRMDGGWRGGEGRARRRGRAGGRRPAGAARSKARRRLSPTARPLAKGAPRAASWPAETGTGYKGSSLLHFGGRAKAASQLRLQTGQAGGELGYTMGLRLTRRGHLGKGWVNPGGMGGSIQGGSGALNAAQTPGTGRQARAGGAPGGCWQLCTLLNLGAPAAGWWRALVGQQNGTRC